jgi:diguanylate cyclase (GGDEF)-like protein
MKGYYMIEFNEQNFLNLIDEVQYLKEEVKRYKYDFLTGFKLRKDFDNYLNTLFEQCTYEKKNFLLILIDIDNLHNINRLDGFDAGDKLIKDVSSNIESAFRDCIGSEIFRIGGDEFGILLKEFQISELEDKLNSINNITYGYSTCCLPHDNIFSPSQLFKMTDQIVTNKKLMIRDRRENK